jgi:Lrp/AsnC family transcriptional regulator, leucine-responsive regulatory protein
MSEDTILTLADRKILSLMEYNPRITFKELATACHLSKDSIKYRINRLEKEKIILGYTSLIDYKKLGNQSYKLFMKINANSEQKEKFKDFLRKQKNVFSIFESNGNWNISIAIFAKDPLDYNKIENSILESFGYIISTTRFCSMIDVTIPQKNLFNVKDSSKTYKLWKETNSHKLDELDKKLIKLMHENARTSLVNLSKELKLSLDAVKNRIKRLKEREIVSIYKTVINYEKIGFDHYKMLIFPREYSDETERKLIEFLKQNKNCVNIIRTIGPWKLEAEFLVKKTNEIEKIENKLHEIFQKDIRDLETSIIRNEELFACKELLLE